ncbi:MAG: hypothetical protein ACFE8V_12335 [Promethearchaeota archaeon]
MNKTEKPEEIEDFPWEKFITKRREEPEKAKIQEFIVYQKPGQEPNEYVIKKFDKSKEQNLEILNLIKEILNNTAKLTPRQIIDYCNSQRYFIKLYFKQLQEKNNL